LPNKVHSVTTSEGTIYEYRKNRQYLVGEGRFGTVYRIVNPRDPTDVKAIKVLPADFQGDRKRRKALRLEFQAMAMIRHESLVRVFDLVGHPELGLVLELVPGVDLRSIIEKRFPFDLDQKIDIMLKVLEGIGYLHEHQIYHGDMKPDNIVIDWPSVRIVDYGLVQIGMPKPSLKVRLRALLGRQKLDEVEPLGASPAYMAPEQIDRVPIHRRSDLYSTGMTFFYWFSNSDWPVFPLVTLERGGFDERRMRRFFDRHTINLDPERRLLVQMAVHDHKDSDIPPFTRSLTDDMPEEAEYRVRSELTRILLKMLRRDAFGHLAKNKHTEQKWFCPTYNDAGEVIKDVINLKSLIRGIRERAKRESK